MIRCYGPWAGWLGLAVSLALTGGCGDGRAALPAGKPASAAAPQDGWFVDESERRGIQFPVAYKGKRPLNIRQTIGSGVALWDYDGDGWLDLYLVGHEETTSGGRLFHNRGDGTFEDRTEGSGLGVTGQWHGCAVADVDNDGKPDLLLTGYGDIRLFHNAGSGRFRDVTTGSGLAAPSARAWASSAAFGDVDGDGLLDLYIGRYLKFGPDDIQLCNHQGVQAACGPTSYDAQYGSLYRNLGKGRFRDVSAAWGVTDQHGKNLGVAFTDVNADGRPDLYLGNDEVPGDLLLNQKGKRFKNVGATSGTAGTQDGQTQSGMGVDWGDYDNDGREDLFVATYQFEPASLYRNQGNGFFEHVSSSMGIADVTRPGVIFGAKFVDADNDGWLDLWTVSGHIQDNVQQVDVTTEYRQRMQFFRSEGGSRLRETIDEGGGLLRRKIVGRGLAVGDIDNDGRQDLVVTDLEGPPLVIMNRSSKFNHWISLRLIGSRSNRMAIGAVVRVTAGNRTLTRVCRTDGSYLSASDPRVHFGLGAAEQAQVEVRWPSGKTSRLPAAAAGQVLTVKEP